MSSVLDVLRPQSASVAYTKDSQLPAFSPGAVNAGFYQPRSTTGQSIDIPLAAARYVDMGIELAHNLTAAGVGLDLWLQVYPSSFGLGSLGTILGPQVAQAQIPSGGLCILQAEKGSFLVQTETSTLMVVEVPEFRLPYSFFHLRVTARTAGTTTTVAPDAGEVAFVLNRRA